MNSSYHLCLLLATASLATGTQLVLNPGFETLPFPTSWKNSGAVTFAALNGSTTPARLSCNTTSSLSQTLTASATRFFVRLKASFTRTF